jgi:hypothetical protein
LIQKSQNILEHARNSGSGLYSRYFLRMGVG